MNEKKRVLLVCGAGMSSGIISKNAKKYVKQQNLDIMFEARSTSEVPQYLPNIDLLMVGPHYALEIDKYQKKAEPYDVPVISIPKRVYAMMDGKAIVELAIQYMK